MQREKPPNEAMQRVSASIAPKGVPLALAAERRYIRHTLAKAKHMPSDDKDHTVVIRSARRDDLPRIVELLADDRLGATREDVCDTAADFYIAAFDAIVAQAGNCVIIAEVDKVVVGSLQLTLVPGLSRRGATRAFIEGVRVASSHRGRRIGELLVLDAIGRARAASCSVVQLTTDASRKDAHRFYERLGFVATHVGYKKEIA
jgi:ribosomal protein S18 acetylase RimI-like enzyme